MHVGLFNIQQPNPELSMRMLIAIEALMTRIKRI